MRTKDCTEHNNEEIQRLNLEIAELTEQVKRLTVAQRTLTEVLFREQNQDTKLKESKSDKKYKGSTHRVQQREFKIGDEVRVLSNHKQRRGIIGKIVGYRGQTQLIITSPVEPEDFAVWKNNVAALGSNSNSTQE